MNSIPEIYGLPPQQQEPSKKQARSHFEQIPSVASASSRSWYESDSEHSADYTDLFSEDGTLLTKEPTAANSRETVGAGVAGALTGLLLAGPLGAIAVGASAVYAAKTETHAGKIVRKGGESVASLADGVLENKHAKAAHETFDKVRESPQGKSITRKGEYAIAKARAVIRNQTIHAKQNLKNHGIGIRKRALCGAWLNCSQGKEALDTTVEVGQPSMDHDDDDTMTNDEQGDIGGQPLFDHQSVMDTKISLGSF